MKYLVKIEKVVIGIGLIFATIFLFMNIVLRFLGSSSNWAEEAIRYIMVWITFIGSAICFRKGIHYGIDVILRVKNKMFQKCVAFFTTLCSIIFCGFLLYYGLKFMMFAKGSGQITTALEMPIWIVYLCVPISALLSIIHLIEVFCEEILNVYKIDHEEEGI